MLSADHAPGAGTPARPASADHDAALTEGHRLASFTGRLPSSADLVLGLLRAGGAAGRLLGERGLSASRLEPHLGSLRSDPPGAALDIERTSHAIAAQLGTGPTSSLHLLLAILRANGAGVDLLRLAGADPSRLRAAVMRALMGTARAIERAQPRTGSAPRVAEPVPKHEDLREPKRARTAEHAPPRTGAPAATVAEPNLRPPEPAPVAAAAAVPATVTLDTGPACELTTIEAPSAPVLHRAREVGRVLDLLAARPARVVAVVGDPGAGRTSLIAAAAGASGEKPLAPADGPGAFASPGAFLLAVHRTAPLEAPVALDGGHHLGPDGSDGPAQLLATTRLGRRWLLALSLADLRRLELSAPDLVAAMEIVTVPTLVPEALLEVIESGLDALAESSGILFAPTVARTLMRLAPRYPADRAQPGRSLAIAEIAAARAARLGLREVGDAEIAGVIADAAAVPAAQLLRTDDERYRNLEARLADRVVGHDDARRRIADALRRSHAGFRGRRPLASFLLLGPTGVGKTETARAIADAVFDGEAALVRIDLSEYSEPHTVARLVGSPPGYVGHEDGGQLTEAIRRRPASVVLLDELEKAHREVLLLLLQVLEDGRLTDGRGRTVDFTASAIVMTSNLGSELYRRSKAPPANSVVALARTRLPPELWNRIDEVISFAPLGDAELRRIVAKIAQGSSERLAAERGISYRVGDDVIDLVLATETDRSMGARPLRRAFERLVEGPIASMVVTGQLRPPARLVARVRGAAGGEPQVAIELER